MVFCYKKWLVFQYISPESAKHTNTLIDFFWEFGENVGFLSPLIFDVSWDFMHLL